MNSSKQLLIAGVAVSIPVVAVLSLAGPMSPVQKGTSAAFWRNACGVDLEGKNDGHMGGFYLPRDGYYIYYTQGFHGQFLYRVPRTEAVADYQEVIRRVKEQANNTDAPRTVQSPATVLDENSPAADITPEQFLSRLREERLNRLRKSNESYYGDAIAEEQAFDERWAQIRRYWINIVFECTFFAGLILFALWPALRKTGRWRRGLHFGALPLLLMLPYYCGYASWTFTSAGPSGGVLYPWVIVWSRDFPVWTSADQWVLVHFPKVLESISQSLGPMLSISGGHMLGPVTAVIVGAGITVLVSAGTGSVIRRKRPCSGASDSQSLNSP